MGHLSIPTSARVYADTSIFIYTIEVNPDYYTLLEPLWTQFYAGTVEIVSSGLTFMETLVVPMRDHNDSLVATYEQLWLASNICLIPINQPILRSAAQLRATTNLKTPDAIHAATALAARPTLFLTNDSQFRAGAGLPVVVLSEGLTS
ncbi:MAG: type II toxin-antitoxin system VapC family toxin [Leptolyngbya sp. IPPAS B-1204]|nr:PIN domain-containing protein [Elainella sp. C42_A2020_010]RNJ66268.1 MAG: PIN domain-containing protein [Leptolyngbya sp. IPPAS B-1204]